MPYETTQKQKSVIFYMDSTDMAAAESLHKNTQDEVRPFSTKTGLFSWF
jgi:hypothetical protein